MNEPIDPAPLGDRFATEHDLEAHTFEAECKEAKRVFRETVGQMNERSGPVINNPEDLSELERITAAMIAYLGLTDPDEQGIDE